MDAQPASGAPGEAADIEPTLIEASAEDTTAPVGPPSDASLPSFGGQRFALPPGARLGGYVIAAELGRGGMGAVYDARHATLDRRAAIKVLFPNLAQENPELALRFLREARLAAQLEHPHVVRIFDVGCDAATGLHYIVQEFVTGGSLAARLREGPLAESEALGLTEQLAEALALAESKGIVHRDIKPDNILLDEEGRARLADLGLAKRLDEGATQLTQAQSSMGTPAYMPPEQIRDAASADHRSDLYSLGATLYEMLVGEPPFRGATVFNIFNKVLHEDAAPPRERRPELSLFTSQLIRALLAKDPAERPASAEALLRMLRERSAATPPPLFTPPVIALCAVALVSTLGALAFVDLSPSPPEPPPREGPSDPQPPPVTPPTPSSPLAAAALLATGFEGLGGALSEPRALAGLPGVDEARARAAAPRSATLRLRLEPDWGERQVRVLLDLGAHARGQGFFLGLYRPEGELPYGEVEAPGLIFGFWQLDALIPCPELFDGEAHVITLSLSEDGERVRVEVDGAGRAVRYLGGGEGFPEACEPAWGETPQLGQAEGHREFGPLRGAIEDLIVWRRALRDADFAAIAAARASGQESELLRLGQP